MTSKTPRTDVISKSSGYVNDCSGWNRYYDMEKLSRQLESELAALKQQRREDVRKCEAEIPTTWLDPLLSGKDAVISTPINGQQIERLLLRLQMRIRAAFPDCFPTPEQQMAIGGHTIGIFKDGKLIAADADVFTEPSQPKS